jgi:hypothetical protein
MSKPEQPSLRSREELADIMDNAPTVVRIPGTRKRVRLRWIKPYTLERLTRVWLERENAAESVNSGAEVLKDMALEPYFAFKEAALMILNHDIKIRLFYGLYWRILAHRYNETQILPIVEEGKKKLPLMAHYEIMTYSADMRTDWKKLTKKEAEQYRAAQLSDAKRLLSRISPLMGILGGGFSDGSETSASDASSPAPR